MNESLEAMMLKASKRCLLKILTHYSTQIEEMLEECSFKLLNISGYQGTNDMQLSFQSMQFLIAYCRGDKLPKDQ